MKHGRTLTRLIASAVVILAPSAVVLVGVATPALALECAPSGINPSLSAADILPLIEGCGMTDPQGFAEFLAGHPELEAAVAADGTGEGLAALGAAGAETFGAVGAAGVTAFVGTCTVLKALPWWNDHSCSAGASRVFGWVFGSSGDDRSKALDHTTGIPGSLFLWHGSTDPQPLYPGLLGYPPLAEVHGGYAFAWRLVDDSVGQTVDVTQTCHNDETGTDVTSAVGGLTNFYEAPAPTYTDPYGYSTDGCGSGKGLVQMRVTLHSTGAVQAEWKVDPPQPWTVTPHIVCDEPDGTQVTVNGTATSIGTPTPGQNIDVSLPSCPATTVPVAGTLTGGRTGSETGLLAAVPVTSVGDSTSTSTSTDNGDGSTSTQTTGSNPSTGEAGGSDNCMGAFWSWNPVDWVFTPIKCALKWAFVPAPDFLTTQADSLQTSLDASPIGTITTAFTNVMGGLVSGVATLADSASCEGPALPPVPPVGLTSPSHLFSTCSAPQSTWASVARPVVAVVVLLGSAMLGLRILSASLGLNLPIPHIRFGGASADG